jgi:hypothetical protein
MQSNKHATTPQKVSGWPPRRSEDFRMRRLVAKFHEVTMKQHLAAPPDQHKTNIQVSNCRQVI